MWTEEGLLVPSNLPPQLPPPIPNMFPLVDHVEGGDENQPHNSAHNSTSTANQDVVAAQLAAMQQQFGVFQLVLAQLLARNNPDSLEKLVVEQRGAPPPHHPADSIPHPLNTNITLEPYPAGFKIPQLETYDGTKDPDDHLHAFYSCMQAQNVSDTLMCKIFPSTLRGNARTWYYSIPLRSISSYTEMASAFATKFSNRRLVRKTTSELMRVKQRDGESLKNYMSRFNDAVLEVSSFDQAVGIAAVISGLKHDRFRDSLIKHPATTFSEVNDRSLKFITVEEYALSQNPTPYKNQNLDWRDENPSRKRMRMAQNRVVTPHNDPLVTSVMINNCEVQRVLVDIGSAPDIMHFHCFESLGLDPALLQRYDGPIYGFNNQPVQVEGVLTLHVAFESGQTYVTPSVRFLVVKMASSFNVVIDRPILTEIRAVVSQSHLCMKFPTPMRIATLRGNQEVARHCYITSVKQPKKGKDQTPEVIPQRIPDNQQVMGVEIVDNQPDDETRVAPVEDVEEVHIDDRDPSRKTQIGTRLNPEERAELIAFLRANNDVFAWTSVDMPRIPTSISQHKLNTNPLKKPVAQKRRLFGGERLKQMANGKWRMCIDYTNLNQACPKDCYSMPNIDKLVEAASGNERLSLLDAYSGYHQVPMAPEDEEKTLFYAGDEIYCYVMIPFGLKNAGATYQKMVTIVFRAQIGRNLEVYVDDIMVKSLKAENHLIDLEETFNNLRKNKMRLNPAKCIFGVESEKFLGFMVSRRGIEVNPEKIKAVAEMEPLKSVTDVQRLTGRVAALHRFISKLADKCLTFFKIMRLVAQKDESGKQKKFEWNSKCQATFDELKSYLSSPPLLIKANDGEILYLYLGISDEAISSVLVREEGKQQKPVYYTSSVLHGAEIRYSIAEKAALTVKPECSRRLIKWAVELGEFEITFQQRSAIWAQALADFIVECTSARSGSQSELDSWILYVDGASSNKGSGAGVILLGPDGSVFVKILDEPSFVKPKMMEISTDPNTPSWTDPIISLLQDGTVPTDKQEEMRLRKKASRYTLVNEVLYKRSFSLPLLCCLNPYEAEYALRGVHEGVCGSHIGALTLAHKVLRQGYYWPNMYKDATQFVQRCQKCPFMKGVGGVTHLIVGVDYFTKWVEARPLSSLTSKKVEDFVFSSIICRYEIPNRIVADNGTQFNCSSFRDFCSSYGIKLQFISVYHPESNGMVESVNKVILKGIKPRLELHKARWADKLNNALWAYRTTSRTATGETPYHLAFGTETVIPIEIGVPSFRVTHFDEGRNGELLRENLDLLDEVREKARLRTLVYKQKIANFYNKRVRPRTFKVGDLVLRKAGLTGFKTRFEKLAPNWEGPYIVAEVPHPSAYILRDTEGKRVPRVWNVNNLKKFYP
ncbi:hypothetical protein SLEP1_g35338 [Rubroshorea leprosula]|uniref:Integrase catalytic domain-containing protein n=1 Tax=Rubroshorea leprosula TaxID=152421 RepID=A0AAV5KMT7_9ROSI|nr:hypothetical protein SLEP1_g35338 [Rubroshorea leprosula]